MIVDSNVHKVECAALVLGNKLTRRIENNEFVPGRAWKGTPTNWPDVHNLNTMHWVWRWTRQDGRNANFVILVSCKVLDVAPAHDVEK